MNLEKLEQIEKQNLQVAEIIPFISFSEKLKLVNQEISKGKYVEIIDRNVYSTKKWR